MQTFLGIILGGSFLAFIEFLINRHDKQTDKLKEIAASIERLDKRISNLDEKMEERDAINARIKILRFDDELRDGKHHSFEYFKEILNCIDVYEEYCSKHERFKNTFTVSATHNIVNTFERCKEENLFD